MYCLVLSGLFLASLANGQQNSTEFPVTSTQTQLQTTDYYSTRVVQETICLLDKDGNNYNIDGDYDLQDENYNSKSVYYKQGYSTLISDKYIYYGLMNSTQYAWIISSNISTISSNYDSYCMENVEDPSSCLVWYSNHNGTVELDTSILFGSDYCDTNDNYICISSTSDVLSNVEGTYRQINQNVALWIHELSSSANVSAYIQYSSYSICSQSGHGRRCTKQYGFLLNDLTSNEYAYCSTGTKYDYNTSLYPDLCSQWYVQTQNTQYTSDSSFSIKTSSCSSLIITNATATICMEQSSDSDLIFYSTYNYLWGEFVLDETDTYNGKPFYYNPRLSNTTYAVSIVYSSTQSRWTLVDSSNSFIAMCDEDSVEFPYQCSSCWKFGQQNQGSTSTNVPCVILVTEGNCSRSYEATDNYTEYVCLTTPSGSPLDASGGYTLVPYQTIDGRNYWTDGLYQIFYDSLLRYWILASSDNGFYCTKYDTNDVSECQFYSFLQQSSTIYPYFCANGTYVAPYTHGGGGSSSLSSLAIFAICMGVLCFVSLIGVISFKICLQRKRTPVNNAIQMSAQQSKSPYQYQYPYPYQYQYPVGFQTGVDGEFTSPIQQGINQPQVFVNRPQQVVSQPQVVNQPQQAVNQPQQAVNQPQQTANPSQQDLKTKNGFDILKEDSIERANGTEMEFIFQGADSNDNRNSNINIVLQNDINPFTEPLNETANSTNPDTNM